ncbi:hypothetical protein T06_1747 [Trichinella sp. T6]|nr:hypothetical protein T06_14005 [Trichinella sp. T6]KRX39609.1 hypothetical protein T06_1747 [Trichinella sp. T6]
MKENRVAQNKEILNNKLPYTKSQPSSIRFNGVPDGLLPCVIKIGTLEL